MGKKTEKGKGKCTKTRMKEQRKGKKRVKTLERFLAATAEELVMAINELPDGIILEVYFEDESH